MNWPLVALLCGIVAVLVPPSRCPAWAGATAIAAVSVLAGITSVPVAWDAVSGLGEPVTFLLLSVPLAALLDRVGFFAAVAALISGGKHLRLGLWLLACAVTVVFNLDASIVLLTPLYVRIAERHHDDPVTVAFIPALTASLASSAIPVSNLTNLVLAEHLDLSFSDFVVNAAPASLGASVVGWLAYRRIAVPAPLFLPPREVVDRRAIRLGIPIVVWLLTGFTLGDHFGVAPWVVAGLALLALAIATRHFPWRHLPIRPALLVTSLGVLALGASSTINVTRLVTIKGVPGELVAFGVAIAGANAINNLPTVLVAMPAVDAHPEHVWALLLGANIGPTLWVTGALSTMLWQASMSDLGHPVGHRRYARFAARVGGPAIAGALIVRLAVYAIS